MRLKRGWFIASWLALACLLGACSEKPGGSTPLPQDGGVRDTPSNHAIAWFDGPVEQAFAVAAEQEKPILLYWGAEWCPPCHELKATIFRREEFIAQSQLFVPVYLDGDTERAQVYGEKFGVFGYPTVIIFDPQGVEITRIPGGMNLQRYLSVLELALNALQPVSELLLAVEGGKAIRDEDWQLLASYAWDQDRGRALRERDLFAVLSQLAQACPARLDVEKSRLQMAVIARWAAGEERNPAAMDVYREQVFAVLSQEKLWRANLNSWIFSGGDIVHSLAEGERQLALQAQIAALLEGIIADPDYDVLTRTDAIYAWAAVNRVTQPEEQALTDEQVAWIREQVEAAREELNGYQMHVALNTIAQLYFELGLQDEARLAAEEGMRVSRQPYYFMSVLGYMERQAGNEAAALDWYHRAWEASRGPATRVQWGVNYLSALIELSPEELVLIQRTGGAVFDELAAQEDGLHHRNSARMKRLSKRLLAWADADTDDPAVSDERQAILRELRQRMDRLCDDGVTAGDAAETCATFLVQPAQA